MNIVLFGNVILEINRLNFWHYGNHNYTTNDSATDDAVFSAGMDSNCGGFTQKSLLKGLESGEVNVDNVRQAMYNLVMVQLRLGLFDDPNSLPFNNFDENNICTDDNLQLSLEAARQGIVLLKNDGGKCLHNFVLCMCKYTIKIHQP